MMKKWIIAIAAAVVVAVGGSVTVAVVLNTPENVIARTISNFASDVLEREEIDPIVDTLKGGSVSLDLKSTDDESSYLTGTDISGKLYFSNKALMLSNLNAKIGTVEMAGDAYISADAVYVKESEILDGAYGAKFSELSNELANSIFAYGSGSDYALDEETYDRLISLFDSIKENKNLEKDAKKLLEKVFKDLWKIVVDNAEITSESEDTRISGNKTSVRMIIVYIDANAAENIIVDAYDYLKNSDDIIDFIDKYEDMFLSVLGNYYDENKHDSLSEAYEEFLDDYADAVDSFCDSIDRNFDSITVKMATPKLSAKLLKLEIKVGKETVFTIDCGKDGIKKTDKITVSFSEAEFVYEVKESSKDKFDSVLTIDIDSGKLELSVSIDKKRNTYNVSYTSYDEHYTSYTYISSFTVKGSISTKGDTSTITLDKVVNKTQYDYDADYMDTQNEETLTLDCTIIIDTKDKMPAPITNYNTLSEITENDIKSWVENLH